MPVLDDLAKRLRGDGVEILAVSVDQERANVTKFLRARSKWALTIAHDPKGAIADRLAPEKMPTSYVIDREGIVRYVNSGFVPSDAREIERRLVDVARR
jgi:peroxiredoxin